MKRIMVLLASLLLMCQAVVAQTRKGTVEITGDVKVSELVKKHIEFNEKVKTVPGYRIQIASLSGPNSRTNAFEMKARFKEEYPDVEVYIVFAEPNFRIKVGDFTSKLDAFVFMRRINDKYPGTIVTESVYPIHPDWSSIVPETDADAEL